MDGVSLTAVGVAVGTNLVLVAYSYGKIQQTVKDLSRRVGHIEDKLNGLRQEKPK